MSRSHWNDFDTFSYSSRTSSPECPSATTSTSASNYSSYEDSQAEVASCCPLCGFQILEANHSGSDADTRTEFIAAAMASIANDSTSASASASASATLDPKNNNVHENTWPRSFSFMTDQQEQLLNGCNIHSYSRSHSHSHHAGSSMLRTATAAKMAGVTTGRQANVDGDIDTKPTNSPADTCWVCLQEATMTAEKRQIEDDRKLAASLAAILLEEQRDLEGQRDRATGFSVPPPPPPNNNNSDDDDAMYSSRGDQHRRITSHVEYGPYLETVNNISHYRDHGLLPQEWLGEGQGPISAASAPVATTRHIIEEDESPHQNYDRSNDIICKRKTPVTRDSNIKGCKQNTTANGGPYIYIGEYNILGQCHGSHGELIWDSGDRYVGTFENGMRSGQGTFFFRDGSEYTGDWIENQMHGCGQRKFANGDTYVGQYHKGQRSGGPKWKLKFSNGDLYVGGWEADRFHGFGRYFYADGSVLEGKFVYGVKQGKFKRHPRSVTGDLDILRFEDDRLVGQGVRWNTKRTKTWLLELRNTHDHEGAAARIATSDDVVSRKKKHRRAASRMVRGIGNLTRRRDLRHRKTNYTDGSPSLVGDSDKARTTNDEERHAIQSSPPSSAPILASSLSPSSSPSPSSFLPLENVVPVVPQESTKTIVKKSARIPISQAVSIGYDCEIGTRGKVIQVSVK